MKNTFYLCILSFLHHVKIPGILSFLHWTLSLLHHVKALAVKVPAIFLFIPALVLADPTGREVMEKQKNMHKVSSEIGSEKMILVDKSGKKENRDLKRYSKEAEKDVYRGLVVFLGPSDIRGTALLNWQHKNRSDDQWLHLPAQGKMQRIAEGGKKNYFMGTDFTYEDLQSEDIDVYNYNVLRKEKCDTHECYVIEATPKTPAKEKETAYKKRVLWIRTDVLVTTKTEFYDKRDKLLKTQTNLDFENIKGTVWRSKKGIMDNHKANHKTLVMTVERKVDTTIADPTFTERFVLSGQHTN